MGKTRLATEIAEEIKKEQDILNAAQSKLDKKRIESEKYKANEEKLSKLAEETLDIETKLGIEGARITKKESQANSLQSKVTELVQKNRKATSSNPQR